MPKRVTIVQEYVPTYRRPLFNEMRALAPAHAIDLVIATGSARSSQAARSDGTHGEDDLSIAQREWSVLGRRLAWRQLRDLHRTSDLVVMEQARRNVDAHFALRHPRRRVALWGHGRDFTQEVTRAEARLLDAMTLRAQWFFGYTPESVNHVVEAGFPRERTTVLFNATDTDALRSNLAQVSEESKTRVHRDLQLREHTALFIGALDASKRLAFLVAAGEIVARDVPGFTLVVAGRGPEEVWLERQALSRPWLITHGHVSGQNLAEFLSVADVIAMPGRVGLVAVDSLASGVPLVTTRWSDHAPEYAYLTDANSVSSADSVEAYAAAMRDLLLDPSRRARLAQQGRDDSRQLSTRLMAQRFIDGISHALDS